jgi:hypothetical protein
MQQLQEALRQEKTAKEKALRERDMATAEKTSSEQNLAVRCFICFVNTRALLKSHLACAEITLIRNGKNN